MALFASDALKNLSVLYLYNKIPYSSEDELDFHLSTQANLQKTGEQKSVSKGRAQHDNIHRKC